MNPLEVSYNMKFPFIKPSMYAIIVKTMDIMLVIVNSKRKKSLNNFINANTIITGEL